MSSCEIKSLPSQKDAAKRSEVTPRLISSNVVPPALKAFAQGKTLYSSGPMAAKPISAMKRSSPAIWNGRASRKPKSFEEANLVLINTCAVRENAEEKIYGEIGLCKARKEADPDFLACLSGLRDGRKRRGREAHEHLSLYLAHHRHPRCREYSDLLDEVVRRRKAIVDVRSFAGEVVESLPSVRLSPFEAFVNISYGCDKFCTYCIVPYTRGRERSRYAKDILKECEDLVKHGYKEITLLGQNVNSYGLDLKDGTTFALLLEEVAKLGVPRLRFLTSYPSQFTDEMIEVMAQYPNIVPWLHFPVQSGSTSCLKRMGRRYTREGYLALVKKLREAMPNIAITTDIIVGFPGETEEEFADTLSLAEEVHYSAAFTFIYSPRVGTPAAAMVQVPDEVKHERFDRLKTVIEKTTSEHSLSMVGKTFEVLVEGPSKRNDEVLSGYATNGKLINFKGPAYLTGCLVPVKVTMSHTYSLLGELVGDPILLKAKDVAFLMSKDPLAQRISFAR
jgi:tRNA-2-methylthio-N6-dimethylallyladenosine synthase